MCMNNWGKHSEWILLILLVVIVCACQNHGDCRKSCC